MKDLPLSPGGPVLFDSLYIDSTAISLPSDIDSLPDSHTFVQPQAIPKLAGRPGPPQVNPLIASKVVSSKASLDLSGKLVSRASSCSISSYSRSIACSHGSCPDFCIASPCGSYE